MKRVFCTAFCLILLICLLALPASAVTIEPEFILQPQNYQYPEYSTAMYKVKVLGDNLRATWYLEFEGKTYNLSDNTNGFEPWEGYAGETYGAMQEDANTFVYYFGGIGAELNGSRIWCEVEDGHYNVISDMAYITVGGNAEPPEILEFPSAVNVEQGDFAELVCVASAPNGTQLEYLWYETSSGRLPEIRAMIPEETSNYLFCNTGSLGTRYYVCCVTTSDGGMAYSSVVPVSVFEKTIVEPAPIIYTTSLPDATVGEEYRVMLDCSDIYALFHIYYNPGRANEFDATGLRMTKENELVGTPQKAGTYTFTVCAAGDGGEDYMELTLKVREAPAPQPEPEKPEEPKQEAEKPTPDPVPPAQETPAAPEQPSAPEQTAPEKPAPEVPSPDKIPEKTPEETPEKEASSNGNLFWIALVLIIIGAIGIGIGSTLIVLKVIKKS